MKFSIQQETLLQPINQVIGVVERRQTLPVLANFLVSDCFRLTPSTLAEFAPPTLDLAV